MFFKLFDISGFLQVPWSSCSILSSVEYSKSADVINKWVDVFQHSLTGTELVDLVPGPTAPRAVKLP